MTQVLGAEVILQAHADVGCQLRLCHPNAS